MGYARAYRLLELVSAYACPDHFVALKDAISYYRMLASEDTTRETAGFSSRLYTLGFWTEHFGLINVIV